MKKTYFKIQLLTGSNTLCQSLVILAAKANGGENQCTLKQLQTVAEGEKILYPSLNEGITVELMDENRLHIDRKIGDEYQTVCIIEQVEIMELQSENDIPEELFTQTQN
jgi:hypothetical protein